MAVHLIFCRIIVEVVRPLPKPPRRSPPPRTLASARRKGPLSVWLFVKSTHPPRHSLHLRQFDPPSFSSSSSVPSSVLFLLRLPRPSSSLVVLAILWCFARYMPPQGCVRRPIVSGKTLRKLAKNFSRQVLHS